MTEHKTFPGKVYTVSCAEDTTVVLPDPLGVREAVVLECTAGAQLHVTATAGRLETSSDQAIVTEVFKLAPRRKLALLQGVAGGWLPAGFTELEYLESSGTQFLDTGLSGCDLSSSVECRAELNTYKPSMRLFQGQGFALASNRNENFDSYVTLPVGDNMRKSGYTPSLGSQVSAYSVTITNGAITLNGQSFPAADIQASASASQNDAAGATLKVLAYPDGASYQSTWWVGKLYSFSAKLQNGAVRFIPALRNDDGEPGMWDTVSKSFFSNAGSGTFGYRITRTGEVVSPMSLRDPHRVAPSGVYARKVGENELEIVADTEEISGDGWEWFPDTAEAFEHFCITQEEILTE